MIRNVKGYLTVYLALCIPLILSLYFVLLEGVRQNAVRLETVIATEAGFQSVMAEYHRELFKKYNLFAIDSSYGTNSSCKAYTEAHLIDYISKNVSIDGVLLKEYLYKDFLGLQINGATVEEVLLLSDGNGEVFQSCAAEVVIDDVGVNDMKQIKELFDVFEANGLNTIGIGEEKSALDSKLESMQGTEIQISESESVQIELENPTTELETVKQQGILALTLSEDAVLSKTVLNENGLFGQRKQQGTIGRGNMSYGSSEFKDSILFQEYLMKYFGYFGDLHEESALSYQIEYLINGQSKDVDNLKATAEKLCAIRETSNLCFLMSDQEKKAEVKMAAVAICGALAVPELTSLIETILLMGWASAESIHDVKILLNGGKVPLLKDKSSWNCSLESALSGNKTDDMKSDTGLDYSQYLRILLAVTNLEKVTNRALTLIEADIRLTNGNKSFRIDSCYEGISGVVYFQSSFGYPCEAICKKTYMSSLGE